MERKLASIQRILSLEPIPGADSIEKATVLGWSLVTKTEQHKVGDLVVYLEVDSVCPADNPEFAFLESKKYKIKTIRLRGQISQGLILPVSVLPEGTVIEEGADVTEVLGITKYEPPVPANLAGKIRGNFPSFLHKTDETRIQAVPRVLERHKGTKMYVAEKLDGSSATFYYNEGVFGVCSRNLDLKESEDNSFWRVARQLDLEEKLKSLGKNISIQGELVGEGVQKNKYKLKGLDVRFFNVFDIDTQQFYNYSDFISTIESVGLRTVPIIDDKFVLDHTVNQLVDYVTRKSTLADVPQEGFVFRPLMEERDHQLGRFSFKVINPEFLLKYE